MLQLFDLSDQELTNVGRPVDEAPRVVFRPLVSLYSISERIVSPSARRVNNSAITGAAFRSIRSRPSEPRR